MPEGTEQWHLTRWLEQRRDDQWGDLQLGEEDTKYLLDRLEQMEATLREAHTYALEVPDPDEFLPVLVGRCEAFRDGDDLEDEW